MRYNGLISYSHQRDAELARHLEAALQRFGKPIFKLRGLQIFRVPPPVSWTSGRLHQAVFFVSVRRTSAQDL